MLACKIYFWNKLSADPVLCHDLGRSLGKPSMNLRPITLLLVFLLFQVGEALQQSEAATPTPCAMACCHHQATHTQPSCDCEQDVPVAPTPNTPPPQARDSVGQFVLAWIVWKANPGYDHSVEMDVRGGKAPAPRTPRVSLTVLHCAFLT